MALCTVIIVSLNSAPVSLHKHLSRQWLALSNCRGYPYRLPYPTLTPSRSAISSCRVLDTHAKTVIKVAVECTKSICCYWEMIYTKHSPTVSSKYLVFHQRLFHMHLLSFPLVLFQLMSSLVLLHLVPMFLRILKYNVKQPSHLIKWSKIWNSHDSLPQKCLELCETCYFHMLCIC